MAKLLTFRTSYWIEWLRGVATSADRLTAKDLTNTVICLEALMKSTADIGVFGAMVRKDCYAQVWTNLLESMQFVCEKSGAGDFSLKIFISRLDPALLMWSVPDSLLPSSQIKATWGKYS